MQSEQDEKQESSKHKKKKHKQLFVESPNTEQVDEKLIRRKISQDVAEYLETEQIVDKKVMV